MYQSRWLLCACIVVCGLVTAVRSFGEDEAAGGKSAGGESAVRALMEEKRDVMENYVQLLKTRHQSGEASHSDMLRAEIDLGEAQLDLAVNVDERIAILEAQVQRRERLEDAIKKFFEVGGEVSYEDVFQATVDRIDAEIALAREGVMKVRSR